MDKIKNRATFDKPGHLIRRLQQIAVALFFSETRKFDITPVQYATLLAIKLHPDIDQTALVNVIAIDRSTIGAVVARLAEKRLIERSTGAEDARTKVLRATSSGERLLKEMEPSVRAAQRKILAPLSVQEQESFMQMLAKLVDLNNQHSRAPLKSKEERGRRR